MSPGIILAKNETDIEGSASIGTTNTTRMAFEATDWSSNTDVTPPDVAPRFSPTRLMSIGPSPSSQPSFVIMSGLNYVKVTATALAGTPTVDGTCSSGEYSGAASASNANLSFFAGIRSDTSFAYLCVTVSADTTNDSTSDWGELLFDTDLSGTALPNSTDRLFRVTSGVSGTFTEEKGNGSAWILCGASCDGGNNATGKYDGSNEVYEFQIRFSDVWGSNSPAAGAIAGFAIIAHNQSATLDYTWGADNVVESVPSTWGQLEIPEFQDFAVVCVSVLVVLGMVLRRRRS